MYEAVLGISSHNCRRKADIKQNSCGLIETGRRWRWEFDWYWRGQQICLDSYHHWLRKNKWLSWLRISNLNVIKFRIPGGWWTFFQPPFIYFMQRVKQKWPVDARCLKCLAVDQCPSFPMSSYGLTSSLMSTVCCMKVSTLTSPWQATSSYVRSGIFSSKLKRPTKKLTGSRMIHGNTSDPVWMIFFGSSCPIPEINVLLEFNWIVT